MTFPKPIAAIALSTLLLLSLALPSVAKDWVVTQATGAPVYLKGTYPDVEVTSLPKGTRFQSRESNRNLAEILVLINGQTREGIVPVDFLAACFVTKSINILVKNLQICLNRRGYRIGSVDGVYGSKTKAALNDFIRANNTSVETLGLQCAARLVCEKGKTVLPINDRPASDPTRKALDAALAGETLTAQRRLAQQHFKADECEKLQGVSALIVQENTHARCLRNRKDARLAAAFLKLIDERNCTLAATVAHVMENGTNLIANCHADKLREDREASLGIAVQAQDCEQVARLETQLGRQGMYASCIFRRTISAGDAGQLIDLAETKRAAGAFDDARTVLAAVLDRFPEAPQAETARAAMQDIRREQDILTRLTHTRKFFQTLGRTGKRTSSKRLTGGGSNISIAQRALNQLGYGAGKVDGKSGPATRNAIRRFQNKFGYSRTRRVETRQLNLMVAMAERMDLRYLLHKLSETPYQGQVDATLHATLIPSCRLSRRSTFGIGEDSRRECGYIDPAGNWIVPPVFDGTAPFSGTLARVSYYQGKDYVSTLIDQRGLIVFPDRHFSHLNPSPKSGDWEACEQKERCGILSPDATSWIVPPTHSSARALGDGYYLVADGDEKSILNPTTNEEITGDFIGWIVLRIGNQLITAKDDTITVFGNGAAPSTLKQRGYLTQDCSRRFSINDPDGNLSYIYRPGQPLLSVPGFFQSFSHVPRECRDVVVYVDTNQKYGLLNVEKRTIIATFDRIEPDNPDTGFLVAGNRTSDGDYEYGVIDWAGKWVVSPRYRNVKIEPDGTVVAADSAFSISTFAIETTPDGYKTRRLSGPQNGEWAYFINRMPGYYKVSYGNGYHYAGGEFILTKDGDVLPKTARRELDLYIAACEEVLGKSNKETNRLRRACEGYIEMRATRSDINPTPNAAAMYSQAYVQAQRGHPEKSLDWITRSGNAGFVRAQAELGFMYAEGEPAIGAYKNDALATKWLLRAANNGDDNAQFNLSLMYFDGRHFAQDYRRSYHWARQAAAQGNPDGIHNTKILEGYFAALAASQRRQARRPLTLLDVWRGVEQYMPSSQDIERERNAEAANRQCNASVRQCYAGCQGQSKDGIVGDLGSDYARCKSRCARISCN